MDKDVLIDKLKDFVGFLVCVAIILAIAYFSGFLKGFTPADFQDAFARITDMIPKSGVKTTQAKAQNGVRYNNYITSPIPENVLRASKTTTAWARVLNSGSKSVFYVYDDTNKDSRYSMDFHNSLQNYISRSPVKTHYSVYTQSLYLFKNTKTSDVGPSKICNSLEECNEQRQKAVDYDALQNFFARCSKTMCVINPAKREYVVLKKRDYDSAVQMLNALANW